MRRRVKLPPPQEIRTATGPVQVGGLVRYYRDGWYYGYLDHIDGATVKIRPIAPKFGAVPRLVIVPTEDVRTT